MYQVQSYNDFRHFTYIQKFKNLHQDWTSRPITVPSWPLKMNLLSLKGFFVLITNSASIFDCEIGLSFDILVPLLFATEKKLKRNESLETKD